MAIMGMGYEIKRETPFEAVQVVLLVIGATVTLAQLASMLTMILVQPLLITYGVLEGLAFLACFIVVICVKEKEVWNPQWFLLSRKIG